MLHQHTNSFGETVIGSFDGDNRFLSNFWIGEPIIWNGLAFATAEHAYQWSKTEDLGERELILFTWEQGDDSVIVRPSTPGEAKRMGAKCTKLPDWDEIKTGIMLDILRAKFTQDGKLRQMLLNTGDALLIEGNKWHDNFWGSCHCEKCGNKGRNVLGNLLMQVREELRQTNGHMGRIACLGTPTNYVEET
jgi:ribA/ribD-fused uncharacterized protein